MVTFNFNGILQTLTIPANICSVTILAEGAQGGSYIGVVPGILGGLGASIQGDFSVTPGETLSILVGEKGMDFDASGAGGGGGSFVWRGNGFGALNAATLLVAAGGGGGAGNSPTVGAGGLGLITENGGNGFNESNSGLGGSGGTSSSGGLGGTGLPPSVITNGTDGGSGFGGGGGGGGATSDGGGGAGAGISGNGGKGGDGSTLVAFGGTGGTAIISGGAGGFGLFGDGGFGGDGGIGGGGGAGGDQDGGDDGGGGGGGGFSGGGGGGAGGTNLPGGGGGGGGSFNSGLNQINTPGVRAGQGIVEITFITDTEPPIIECPDDITVMNELGKNGSIVNYPPPTVSDNCAVASSVCSPPSGSFFPTGTTTVICTATDTVGNTSTCSFTVTVIADPCRVLSSRCRLRRRR